MNAIDAVSIIRMLRMKLETTPQTDPGAATLQRVIDHLGMQVKFLTEPKTDDGGPAFPWGEHGDRLGGMTMREVFACHAPDVPNDFDWKDGETDFLQRLVRWRWHYADAMLKARQS